MRWKVKHNALSKAVRSAKLPFDGQCYVFVEQVIYGFTMNRKRRLDSPTTSAQEAAPSTKDQHKDDRTGDPLLEVEIVDISIDGMCGVY